MTQATSAGVAFLVPIAGPELDPIELTPKDGGLTLGRHEQCELRLPPEAEKVSRFHARFMFDDRTWRIADLNSRWGTYVNGVKLAPGPDVPLNEGDLVRITPWTFSFSSVARPRGLQSTDDTGQTLVRQVSPETTRLADDTLALLLETASSIHAAQSEQQLAELVIDAALRGTGLRNAVLLRPLDAAGRVEIIASRFSNGAKEAPVTFSRSLIAAASQGHVAEISADSQPQSISQSIVQMKISAALCVPLLLGGGGDHGAATVAAYLYLDSRGTPSQPLRPSASAFCVALGRIASLALANLKRVDMERRQAAIEAELSAAAAAQKWIFPRRETRCGTFVCIGESRAGRYVGGDFFDIIDLGAGKLAVAVGDVSGKGIAASVLMTATQGYLHAALREHMEPGRAVSDVNRFVHPRRPESKFVTMWVGIFDAKAGTLRYVDAGHSYAVMKAGDGTFTPLDAGGGLPIGITPDGEYPSETVPLAPGGCAVIVSDGIIEQFGAASNPDGSKQQFEMASVRRSLSTRTAGPDEVADLFAAVIEHAGTDNLADDATAVLVRW